MEYIIVVDFEATCFADQPRDQLLRKSEIIEFPAVMLNLKTGRIEAEFHKYLKPTEKPTLSNYCKNLTGITQETVDKGIELPKALELFHDWLQKELTSRNLALPEKPADKLGAKCAFASWTDWDFGIVLDLEFKRKGLSKPPYFNYWIDLRAIFYAFYKVGFDTFRNISFAKALSRVGLKFEGQQHSGIDDARNTARLAFKIVSDGGRMAITS